MCPSKVVFVLKEGSKWIKNHGQDFSAALKPPSPESQGLYWLGAGLVEPPIVRDMISACRALLPHLHDPWVQVSGKGMTDLRGVCWDGWCWLHMRILVRC